MVPSRISPPWIPVLNPGPCWNTVPRGERAPHSTLPEIERKKFLVPSTMQCYEYLGAKNQCDLKIIQLPLTRIKWKLLRCINICIYIYMELTNARVWQTSIRDDLPLLYTTIYTILIYSSIKICSSLCLVLLQFNPIINYIGAVYRLPMFFLLQGPRNWLLWSPRPPTQAAASGKLLISCLLMFIGDMNFIAVGPEQHGQGQGVPVWWHILRLQHAREMMGGHILNHDEPCVGFRSSAFFAELDLVMPWWGMIAQSWTVL